MDYYYIIALILVGLAIFDLVVGVGNDAVNFLNSAIGSKAASFRTILIIASLGVFVGATFSTGMMEVARKGIFNPTAFTFEEIMAIFVAVMLTDILLLDLFNTLGLPTSTTVSIVFELLGAAVAIALVKMTALDQGLGNLHTYINGQKALEIMAGILLSVVMSFTVGSLIMYVSRLLYSFRYEKRIKWVGGIWGGLALTAMTYFLLLKGLKHASFITKDQYKMVTDHAYLIISVFFVFWTIISQVIVSFTRINLLKIVVLFGTFGLAMAFAGNDLVNFIGVPVAGFQAYGYFSGQSTEAGEFLMPQAYAEGKVPVSSLLLLAAGAIMVLTLWFSKKTRTVSETELGLGSQDDQGERFKANFLGRILVQFAMIVNSIIQFVIPESIRRKIDYNFLPVGKEKKKERKAFDLIRASVNLATASMLISFATSKQLPLSTTYVTFMVAMGTSLADRAWGRDSAVYRVSGVIEVIGGWFATALIAFMVSGLFGILILFFKGFAVAGLLGLAAVMLINTHIVHRVRSEKKKQLDEVKNEEGELSGQTVKIRTIGKVSKNLVVVMDAYTAAIEGLVNEDPERLKLGRDKTKELAIDHEILQESLFNFLKRMDPRDRSTSKLYLKVFDTQQDMYQSTEFITKACRDHVRNVHLPLTNEQNQNLLEILSKLADYLDYIRVIFKEKIVSDEDLNVVKQKKEEIINFLEGLEEIHTEGIQKDKYSSRNSQIYFMIISETKDIVTIARRYVKIYYRIGQPIVTVL